jgi:RimJ/RimL family protein N-acetyltransferase
MPEFKLPIRSGLHLSSIRESDKPALLEHLRSKDVYNTTLNIPHPYTEADADFWIHKRIETTKRQGIETTFAIRDANENLIGGIGADGLEIAHNPTFNNHPSVLITEDTAPRLLTPDSPRAHRVEFGYWLARSYWGQGIMTDAVRVFVAYAFRELGLLRLTAHVFESNIASARVLEKNGFKLEGHLRKHFLKDGQLIDVRFYGLLKQDLAS